MTAVTRPGAPPVPPTRPPARRLLSACLLGCLLVLCACATSDRILDDAQVRLILYFRPQE